MKNSNLHGSQKKNSGKGNGNSVINNHEYTTNSVSGDIPSSTSHKFSDNTPNNKNNGK